MHNHAHERSTISNLSGKLHKKIDIDPLKINVALTRDIPRLQFLFLNNLRYLIRITNSVPRNVVIS